MNEMRLKLTQKNQKGFTTLEIVLIVILVGVISFAGFYIYTQNDGQDTQQESTAQSTEDESLYERDESIPPDIFEVEIGKTGSHYGSQITITDKSIENAEYIGLPPIDEVQGNPREQNDSSSEIEDNRRYLVIDFTITNKAPNSNTYIADYFTLETSSKEIIQAIPLRTDMNSWSETTLATGGSFSAKIAFPAEEGEEESATVIWQGPDRVTPSEDVRIKL